MVSYNMNLSFNHNLTSQLKYFQIKYSGITDFNLQHERISSLPSPSEGPLFAALSHTRLYTVGLRLTLITEYIIFTHNGHSVKF